MKRAEIAATLSRVFCGIVFVVHGMPKVMNLADTVSQFQQLGFPGWLAFPVAFLEFFGGLLLIAGFLSRLLAGTFVLEMMVAAVVVHRPHGFDVFHFGDPYARGYEYNLALIVLLVTVLLIGPGRASIDAWLASRRAELAGEAWEPEKLTEEPFDDDPRETGDG